MIQKLRGWFKKIILIKVKSQAGYFLNEMVDERAESSRLSAFSDAAPICPWPNKYGSLQLRIKASFLAQVLDDKLMPTSTVMKLPTNRFYDGLFVSTSYKHVNFAIQCSLVKT